jgi:hypothetical protein
MNKSRIAMTRNRAGKLALLATAFVSLAAGPAQAYPGLPSPSLEVIVSPSGQSENLVCTVLQVLVPSGTNGILARIRVPHDTTLRSAMLKTASGDLALEMIDSMPLVGEYEAIIDSQKTNCASTGTLMLTVEGDLETKTATCPGILLPKLSNCRD